MENLIRLFVNDENKPVELRRVAAYLRFSMALIVPNLIFGFAVSPRLAAIWKENLALTVIIMGVTVGLTYFLSRKILESRVWARNTYLVLTGLGLFSLGEVAKGFGDNFLLGLCQALQNGLQIYAAYLLFLDGPTKNHFKQSKSEIAEKVNAPIDEVAKLHVLFKSGALTQDEFEAEKKKVLQKAA